MTEETPRLYGVSFGNGNNGVSRMFADYYVTTSDPWRLASAAVVDTFNPGLGMAWAARNVETDGEAEYGITAVILNPPADTPDGEYPESEDEEGEEDGRNWCENNGAWLICEVFPEDAPRDGTPVYDSIEDALSAGALVVVGDA